MNRNLIMEMRPGRKSSCTSYQSDQIPSSDFLTTLDQPFRKVSISRLDAVPMIDTNISAHSRVIAGDGHSAFSRSPYFLPQGRTNIQP